VFDKRGTNLTGIGANGVADTIYFGACDYNGAWITDYLQIWQFNGTIKPNKIQIGDGVIEWDASNGGFKVTGGLWATDYLSSKGVNTGASGGGGGGSSYQRLDTWDGYTSAKDGWVLSAKLGYGLKTTQDDILRQLADISGQGTNVTFTPALTSGTQIGTLTIDGEPVKMYAPSIPTADIEKGVTAYGWGDHSKAGYLVQHQDLSGYQTKITDSNKLAASLVSGLAAVATSGKYSDLSGTPTSLPASDVSAWAKAATKPTYKFSEITDKPTTIGGYGITDAYTKSQVDSALGGYLPLSGGTITGDLSLNQYLRIKAWVGYGSGSCDMWYNGNTGILHLTASNIANYHGETYIHSGNIGSQSVASATKLQTARSIWGQSFDGTGGVGGNLHLDNSKIYWHSDSANYYIDNYYDGTNSPLMRYMGYSGHRFMTSSGEVMRISSSGNVGIGTTSPQYKLDVNGTGKFDGLLNINIGNSTSSVASSVAMELHRTNADTDASGVNIALLAYQNKGILFGGGGFGGSFHYRNGSTNTEIMRLSSNGNVGIGTTNPQYKLDVIGVIHSTTGIFSDGYVSAKGQNTSSDMRLKRVLEEVTLSVEDIAAAPAFRFAWKGGAGVDVGTSAQYWEKLEPDAVKRDDAGWRMMQYGNVAMVAVIALARRVKELEEKLKIKS
jgi:hypothetical protein